MKFGTNLRWGISLAVIVVGGAGLAAALTQMQRTERRVPVARVQRGNFDVRVHTTGEMRPVRTAMLVAPQVGGTLQIVRLLKTGTPAEPGQVIVEFDPSEQEYNLEQARSRLLEAEQEITKMRADAAVQEAQDAEALLRAGFDLKRWELDVQRAEVLSAIDAQKNKLSLEEAQRRLAQLTEDVKSRQASNRASLAVLEEKRNKARLEMQQAQQNIDNMTLRSTIRGLVSVKENRDASGGFFFSGMVLPEYREGDVVWPGRFIAEVVDTSQLEIRASISEQDRGNLEEGREAEISVDANPNAVYRAKVKTIAGATSRARWWDSASGKRFDATFEITGARSPSAQAPASLPPGVTAQIVIIASQLKEALYLPRQAVFEKEGKPIVYVRKGSNYESREVKVKYRTESRAVVEGLPEGTEVALVNPEQTAKRPAKAPAPAGPAVGGGR